MPREASSNFSQFLFLHHLTTKLCTNPKIRLPGCAQLHEINVRHSSAAKMRLTAWFVVSALADFCWAVPNFGPKRYSSTVTPPPCTKVPFTTTTKRRILASIAPLASRRPTFGTYLIRVRMRPSDSIYTNSSVMSKRPASVSRAIES